MTWEILSHLLVFVGGAAIGSSLTLRWIHKALERAGGEDVA
jgi:hypothetical protein